MSRVSLNHFIDKFVNEWKHINWLMTMRAWLDIRTGSGEVGKI